MRALVLALLAVTGTGCATLVNDHSEVITIHSEPAGAAVTIDGRPAGVTPLRVPVSSHSHHVVQVFLPGYRPQICRFTSSGGAGWLVLDLVTTWFFGLVIDLVRDERSSLDQGHCVVMFSEEPRDTGSRPPAR